MRLLLDEQVPRVFADSLPGYDVDTAQAMGWSGLENGDLLRAAADAGFDALVTLDRGIEFQQNLAALPLSVLVVRARSNRIEDLEPLVLLCSLRLRSLGPDNLFGSAYDSRGSRRSLTTEAREKFDTSPLSAREVARRLGTSPAQLYRLLDPTNYSKSLRQLLSLLNVLGYDVEVEIKDRPTPRVAG